MPRRTGRSSAETQAIVPLSNAQRAWQCARWPGCRLHYTALRCAGVNDPFAHGTSGFLPWHRKFLLEFENALRCLVTPPPGYSCTAGPSRYSISAVQAYHPAVLRGQYRCGTRVKGAKA